jgi:hypothetical protein
MVPKWYMVPNGNTLRVYHCRNLCIPCSTIAVGLTLSVVVSATTDPPRLPLPPLLPTIGRSGEQLDDDDINDPTGEPRLLAGRASQTSTAP